MALLGRNGAGKTTTIHTIAGLLKAKRGSIQFSGKQVQALLPRQITRLGIGLVPQGIVSDIERAEKQYGN